MRGNCSVDESVPRVYSVIKFTSVYSLHHALLTNSLIHQTHMETTFVGEDNTDDSDDDRI